MPLNPVVIPSSYQTNRQDLDDALQAIIDAYIASNSYAIVRKFWSELPATLTGEGPFVAVGDVTETIRHTEGLRITVFTGSLWYVDWLTDPQEYNARCNVFADQMRDLFTANPTISPRGLLEQTGFQVGELQQGPNRFGAPQLLYTFTVQEGRS